MINAQIPVQTVTNSPVVDNKFADLETPRVLFMAMDGITDAEKYELPFKAFGGIHLPHIPGLRESRYMLYRCKFTQLPAFTPVGDWDMMVPPEMRQHRERSFTQTILTDDGPQQKVVQGFLESDAGYIKETGEFKQKRSNHLVFHKRYPGNDARKAVQRSAPHGVGGVVEIEALKGASGEEITQAQLFFFPKWANIANGLDELPTTVKAMEAYIRGRAADIDDQAWSESQKNKYRSIAKDMLTSCAEFLRHALNTVKGDEVAFDVTYKAGHTAAANSDASELLLQQTETRRKSDLLANNSDTATDLMREMRAEREAKAANDAKLLQLEERKQYTAEIAAGLRERDFDEEIRLGMRKAEAATSGYVATEPNVQPEAVVTTTPLPAEPYYTPSQEEEAPEPTVIAMHSNVTVDGRTGVVTGKPGGRITVKFDDDGTSKTVAKEEVTV